MAETDVLGRRPQSPALSVEQPTAPTRRLHHFFEASCDTEPTAVALDCDGHVLTYLELDQRANRLAHYLIRRGIGTGNRVGLLLHRSPEIYVALLAVLKTGATYVPIDPSSPSERVSFIAEDSSLDLLLSASTLSATTQGLDCPVLELDRAEPVLGSLPCHRPRLAETRDSICYIIYTSGSTGRPKGVAVAQSSICNFIDVVPAVYGVDANDRVYQGMTLAFDFSIEEVWPTWAVGATLVGGPNDARRLGGGLAEFLAEKSVTVLYCVPTVLATMDRDLPQLRTLIVGGEACPAELVERWSQPGRRILNTYGPTEATVTATWAELHAGKPVTIGRPLPTYYVRLLDEELRPVPDGEVAEICIGGVGVATGYLNRPDLTADRFVPDPWRPAGRLYRTGDLGRLLPDGEIEYLGRADGEVKVRGHRVDLQEIETNLMADEAVAAAVVTLLKQDGPGGELAAYITRRTDEPAEDTLVSRLHQRLRQHLPPYMVPAFLDIVTELPMLPSGKVDRKALPAPSGRRLVATDMPVTPPETPLEHRIVRVWAEVMRLGTDEVSVEADFFLDLGGHSLLAATVVSFLRREGVALSIADLYEHPTVRGLAEHQEALDQGAGAAEGQAPPPHRATNRTVLAAALIQLAVVYLLGAALALPTMEVLGHARMYPEKVAKLAAIIVGTYVAGRLLIPVIGVRLLSLGLEPGRYRLWSGTYLRLWIIQQLFALSPVGVFSGSPLLPPYLRLLGARVGSRCHLATAGLGLPRFVTIGDEASVGYGAQLHTTHVEAGWVLVEPISLGARSFVGANSVVMPGVMLGDDARLADQSLAVTGQAIPAGQEWAGAPSAPRKNHDRLLDRMQLQGQPTGELSAGLVGAFLAAWGILEVLPIILAVPSIALMVVGWVHGGILGGLLAAVLSGPLFVVITCGSIALGKFLVLRRTPTGIYPVRSTLGLRKWVVDKLLESSLTTTNTLYATLYTVPWLRSLGARVGSWSEVSTVSHVDPDLLRLGPESFLADQASVGVATYHRGHIALNRTEIGRRSFIGNVALARSGTRIGDEALVGVHTVAPVDGVPDGTFWLGSPPIRLPRRQESQKFDEALTFRPGRARVVERLAIELLRVTLPATLLAVSGYFAVLTLFKVAEHLGPFGTDLVAPGVTLLFGLSVVVAVAILKWVVIGRYRPRVEPLWSRFVRRTELVTGLYESAAVPALLGFLVGTPLLGPLLRLFGARIGRRTWFATTRLTEFDLVRVGDDVAVGAETSLQTHLFEDRVMKMSVVTVERGATVGPRSIVLYDAVVGADTTLDALSLAMKGEWLVPGRRWRGIPSRAVGS
ncbi:peptide synthetase [Longimycelium tulufanense]|uniref:Peptide synthetase n=1 Tax=Longimycelium tulufanense TaxID=907463 RepID=A0A8J3FWR6_9PSEU|nr:Pls/PosA family non-ribosomal peptide synthetase [Longimycelium tulufanense]GGM79685.1 peptide synthetase [Longimycelium tulufanense]